MISNLKELNKQMRALKIVNPKPISRVYKVVGVSFEGRQELLERFLKNYQVGRVYDAQLLPDNNNAYDKNAVAVALELDGNFQVVGYISKDENEWLRSNLDLVRTVQLGSIGYGNSGKIGLTINVKFDRESNACDEEL